jgi:hypothetical protein
VLVICPTSQAKMPAANWHDGQISWNCENPVKSRAIATSLRIPDAVLRAALLREKPATHAKTTNSTQE